MSIGYESRKCTHAVQGGLLGGHKSTPVRAIPPSLHLPTTNQRSAGPDRRRRLLLITGLEALG
jgi:hypothetical protein